MIRGILLCLVMGVLADSALAQKSAAADKQSASWFHNVRDTFLKRTSGLQANDLDIWEAASAKAGLETTRAALFFALPRFNPLWDVSNKLIPGATAKYAKRLEQIPGTVIEKWQGLTTGDPLYTAMSLTAENILFPSDKFSPKIFADFVAKFK